MTHNTSALSVDLRIRLMNDTSDNRGNLEGSTYWQVLNRFAIHLADPYKDPEDPENPLQGPPVVDNFKSYEFRLNVPEGTGIDVGNTCNYPSTSNRNTGWVADTPYIYLARCRLGNGNSAITLDVRVRGVPSRQARLGINIVPIRVPHHADNTATYRLCGDMPVDPEIDFETEIDAAADLWDTAGVGITFPDAGTDVTSCDSYTSGYTDIKYVSHTKMQMECGSSTALACVKKGTLDSNGEHYLGRRMIFAYPLAGDIFWETDSMIIEDKSDARSIGGHSARVWTPGRIGTCESDRTDARRV